MQDNKKVILLVEDETLIAMEEAMILEQNGYSVITAASGEASVELIESDTPVDLVLMDINLGDGIDGTAAAERILSLRDLPLIFLSSHTEKEVVGLTEDITSYGYIVKNTGETVLLTSIKMAFRLYEANEAWNKTFNSIMNAIMIIDINNRIQKCNLAFEKFAGLPKNKIIGRRCMEIVHESVDFHKFCPFRRMRESGSRERMELPINDRWYEVVVDPLRDGRGQLSGAVHIISDITDIKKKEEFLRIKVRSLTHP